MKLRLIDYRNGIDRQTLTPPDSLTPSIILGDIPRLTDEYRYRVPLVGIPGMPLERQVQLAVMRADAPYSESSPIEQIYDAAARGEGWSASVVPRYGNFDILSPVLQDGRYQAWVIAVE